MKKIWISMSLSMSLTLLFILMMSCHSAAHPLRAPFSPKAKYVFYFIGDGMATVQVHAAEAYLAALSEPDEVPGGKKAELLAMNRFPVLGMCTTFANDRLITGSAAAGTALACGKKTNIGVISMAPDVTKPCASIAELAKQKGMKVGIVTSVAIDHATPAVFYAHQQSRSNYHEIAIQLAKSNFDYFGGGGFTRDETCRQCAIEIARSNEFTFAHTREALAAIDPGTRTIAINHTLSRESSLYYELDRPVNHMSLAEFTRHGIRLLDNPQGFFMMVEGGKIDWACHANDARACIEDIIALDNAVKVAIDFLSNHPQETLIVVTADHECGGMTIGSAATGYDTAFEILKRQTKSHEMFDRDIFRSYKAKYENKAPVDINTEMWGIIYKYFGIDGHGMSEDTGDDLGEYQRSLLEAAFDRSMDKATIKTSEEDQLLYGHYEPLTVTLTRVLSLRAGIG